jgi:plastocyanin
MRPATGERFLTIGLNALAVLLWAFGASCAPVVSTPAAAATSPAGQEAGEQKIKIDNFTFSPRSLTVARGTTVTWVNEDDIPHTATSAEKPRAFDSGALDTDASFSFTFEKAGTYPYFCAVHPHMTGEVIAK